MRDAYQGKYIELDFSQNLALRPKHEVQSAHFSGKQFTLYCAIVEPIDIRYHYHLSDDTKHDGIFVDQVLRDIIMKYDIHDEDMWIQSDNAPSQYKNKLPFGLTQKLANEFNLRIIRTYGAAGHGKGVIDAISSFGVKNILRKDIVTHDVIFNTSEDVTNYLSIKKPQFSYTHITPECLANKRHASNETIPLKQCMKQHMIIFVSHGDITMQEYLCDCTLCLQFMFSECYYHSSTNDAMISATMNEYESNEEEQDDDNYIDRSQQMFDFVEVPSYISLITGNTIQPLYFVKVTEKG